MDTLLRLWASIAIKNTANIKKLLFLYAIWDDMPF